MKLESKTTAPETVYTLVIQWANSLFS